MANGYEILKVESTRKNKRFRVISMTKAYSYTQKCGRDAEDKFARNETYKSRPNCETSRWNIKSTVIDSVTLVFRREFPQKLLLFPGCHRLYYTRTYRYEIPSVLS